MSESRRMKKHKYDIPLIMNVNECAHTERERERERESARMI